MTPTMVYVDNKNRILEPSTLRASLGWEVILSGEGLEDKGVTKCGLQSRR